MLCCETTDGIPLFGACDGLEAIDRLLHWDFGVVIRGKKACVGGDLVAAQTSLLVDDEFFDQCSQSDSLVRLFDPVDGNVGPVDLPYQYGGQKEARDDGKNHGLPEGSFESL